MLKLNVCTEQKTLPILWLQCLSGWRFCLANLICWFFLCLCTFDPGIDDFRLLSWDILSPPFFTFWYNLLDLQITMDPFQLMNE